MNYVEQSTWTLLRNLMVSEDPARQGWCIDAGAGGFDFYFEWFHAFGYPTLTVEPFPLPAVTESCQARHIPLEIAALTNKTGIVTLYRSAALELNTLTPQQWGLLESPKEDVAAVSLPHLANKYAMKAITALKLDIEGAEWQVIQQLPRMNSLPKVISFEFGGGEEKQFAAFGWTPRAMINTLRSINMLARHGYRMVLFAATGRQPVAHEVMPSDGADIFGDDYNWGNIVATLSGHSAGELLNMAQGELRFTP